jgi:hypothetical protein
MIKLLHELNFKKKQPALPKGENRMKAILVKVGLRILEAIFEIIRFSFAGTVIIFLCASFRDSSGKPYILSVIEFMLVDIFKKVEFFTLQNCILIVLLSAFAIYLTFVINKIKKLLDREKISTTSEEGIK